MVFAAYSLCLETRKAASKDSRSTSRYWARLLPRVSAQRLRSCPDWQSPASASLSDQVAPGKAHLLAPKDGLRMCGLPVRMPVNCYKGSAARPKSEYKKLEASAGFEPAVEVLHRNLQCQSSLRFIAD